MNFKHFFAVAALLATAACTSVNQTGSAADSSLTHTNIPATAGGLYGLMEMKGSFAAGDSVLLDFTVMNGADTAMKFCKWHTPFEPLMSTYLEIKNEDGEEAAYMGPMAKRMMPPPADSYITLEPKASVKKRVNLLKAYRIEKPGKYSVKYTGENMSGVTVKDSLVFVYKP